ncbi:MAG: hypothetical protein DRP15_00945 [Candidatus Aenigmatarchaeota archaeon]|nr:MAG: hypothetical protein DRP15_00945 [Candidatus Aenigmarchaeota archaeon]
MTAYKGWNAKILKDGQVIGTAREVRVTVDHSLERYYIPFSRTPYEIREGQIKIDGTIRKLWVDKTYLTLLANTGTLTNFDLELQVNNLHLYIYNCKFSKGEITVPQDGWITEDLDFIGSSIAVVET